jgi:acetyl-CoA carboxylase carboxyl transferase subunit alpha
MIDGIVAEPGGGAHEDLENTTENLRLELRARLEELSRLTPTELVEHRYTKFRQMGNFFV